MREFSVPVMVFLGAVMVVSVTGTKKDYNGYKLVEVTPSTDDQVVALRAFEDSGGVDFWTPAHISRPTTFLAAPHIFEQMRSELGKLGMKANIMNENIQEAMNAEERSNKRAQSRLHPRDVERNIANTFPRFHTLSEWVTLKVANNRDISEIIDIGETHEGREMKVLKIGTPHPNGGSKPAILLDAGIHGREWLTVATMVYIINQLFSEYYTSPEVTRLVEAFDIYILPCANPDGYEYTFTHDRLWRKTRTEAGLGVRGRCWGVDPNRNFDFHWGQSGTSAYPCSLTYGGPRPFSEPCTRNLRDFILQKKDHLKLYISLHAYSQLWLTPYAYGYERPVDAAEMDRVAMIGAEAIRSTRGRVFQVGNPPSILYPASGGSYDWAKGVAGIKYSYALELFPGGGARNGFVVRPEEIARSGAEIWNAFKAVAYAIELGD